MKGIKFAILGVLFSSINLSCQTQAKPLYKIPEGKKNVEVKAEEVKIVEKSEEIKNSVAVIAGNGNGLFKITGENSVLGLWTEGSVSQILKTENVLENGTKSEKWYFVTSKGILYSEDLINFELRNNGIADVVIKKYDGQTESFEKQIEEIKDISVDPSNSEILVTATKNNVYITYDGALSWKSLGSMSKATSGIKAVAVAELPRISGGRELEETELVVFMSHPYFGLAYLYPKREKPVWIDVSSGFKIMPSMSYPDEISDILPVLTKDENGMSCVQIYMSQSFLPNIYKFDWSGKKGKNVYSGKEPSSTIDSLAFDGTNLIFTQPKVVNYFDSVSSAEVNELNTAEKLSLWKEKFDLLKNGIMTAWIPKELSCFEKDICLGELWLLYPEKMKSPYKDQILDKKSLYIPPYQVRKQLGDEGIDKFISIVEENGLNSVVIDMKDDYGLLRYRSENDAVLTKAKESAYSIDVERFISKFKEKNIYLIARIVTFKDRNLSRYENGKYAVWDSSLNKPWTGIRGYEDVKNEETGEVVEKQTVYYDENWVDPYSSEVWEYNVDIAKELVEKGFDEIQFDYIRFPTDGLNLNKAKFRWKTEGMSKESALMSFLAYARENINAPLGIDVYGANGWYRIGSRTGQDVEMLANYVDVICPMFYPSHFENYFLDYEPKNERPYRIYYYGTYRNTIIAKNRILVRPWVQAFKLGVKYDRTYYGKDYVQQEIFGIRDSVDSGYMYWNNLGNYEMIQKDIGNAAYAGKTKEASVEFEKPVFGVSGKKQETTINTINNR